MDHPRLARALLCLLVAAASLPAACAGSDDTTAPDSAGGASAQGGAAGLAGQSGSSGTAGSIAGAGGNAGSGQAGSGQAGSGQAGSGNAGGQGGAGQGGAAGGGAAGGEDGCGALAAGVFARCAKNPLRIAGAPYAGSSPRAQGMRVLGMGDPDVIVDEEEPDPARRWKAYWSVTYGETFAADETKSVMALQVATSPDGVAWEVGPEPALWAGEDGAWDRLKIETPSVVKLPKEAQSAEVRYVMLYSGAGAKKTLAGGSEIAWYQLGLAVSADGISWAKLPGAQSPYTAQQAGFAGLDGLVLLGQGAFDASAAVADGLAADPEITFENGLFHAFFSSFAVDQKGAIAFPTAYGMSHATSPDAIHWTPQAKNPQIFGGTQPSLVTRADGTHELYLVADSDQEIAAAEPNTFNPYLGIRQVTSASLDGFHEAWVPTVPRFFQWDGAQVPEKWGLVKAGDVVRHGGAYHYFYIGMGGEGAAIPPGFFTTVQPGTPGAKQVGPLWLADAVSSLNLARRPE